MLVPDAAPDGLIQCPACHCYLVCVVSDTGNATLARQTVLPMAGHNLKELNLPFMQAYNHLLIRVAQWHASADMWCTSLRGSQQQLSSSPQGIEAS